MGREGGAHKVDDDLEGSSANVSMNGFLSAILVDTDSSKDLRSRRR